MAYANRKQMSSNRTASIIVVAILHVVLGYALVTGLAYNVIKKAATDLKTFNVEEPPPPPEEKPPPPEDQPDTPPPPQVAAPPPLVQMNNPMPSPIQATPNPPPFVPTPIARPAPPSPPAPVKKDAAKARGNLLNLFGDDDYPNSALQNNEQGTTAVVLSIGTDGRVSGCSITSSSGSSALDNATCNVLRRRARFTPATDTSGNPTTDTYPQRVTWRVPPE